MPSAIMEFKQLVASDPSMNFSGCCWSAGQLSQLWSARGSTTCRCVHALSVVTYLEHVAVVSFCRTSGPVAVLDHSTKGLLDLFAIGVSRRLA